MRSFAALMAVLALGCFASVPDRGQEHVVLEDPLPTSDAGSLTYDEAESRKGAYDDVYLRLQDWRGAVLDRADRGTLLRLRDASRERLQGLEARDAELAANPPHLVRDARLGLFEQIAFENERLRLIEETLAR